jgi:hypothetical protein
MTKRRRGTRRPARAARRPGRFRHLLHNADAKAFSPRSHHADDVRQPINATLNRRYSGGTDYCRRSYDLVTVPAGSLAREQAAGRAAGPGANSVGVDGDNEPCPGGRALAMVAARGRSSMVERQLPKLHTRVRFPSPAPVSPMRTGTTRLNPKAHHMNLPRIPIGQRQVASEARRHRRLLEPPRPLIALLGNSAAKSTN